MNYCNGGLVHQYEATALRESTAQSSKRDDAIMDICPTFTFFDSLINRRSYANIPNSQVSNWLLRAPDTKSAWTLYAESCSNTV